jgi:hypothetical protein
LLGAVTTVAIVSRGLRGEMKTMQTNPRTKAPMKRSSSRSWAVDDRRRTIVARELALSHRATQSTLFAGLGMLVAPSPFLEFVRPGSPSSSRRVPHAGRLVSLVREKTADLRQRA